MLINLIPLIVNTSNFLYLSVLFCLPERSKLKTFIAVLCNYHHGKYKNTILITMILTFLKVDNSALQESSCALQEVTGIALRLKSDNVIANQATVDVVGDIAGQEVPAAYIGPGNVNKLLHHN